jgi:hypothetical protein
LLSSVVKIVVDSENCLLERLKRPFAEKSGVFWKKNART